MGGGGCVFYTWTWIHCEASLPVSLCPCTGNCFYFLPERWWSKGYLRSHEPSFTLTSRVERTSTNSWWRATTWELSWQRMASMEAGPHQTTRMRYESQLTKLYLIIYVSRKKKKTPYVKCTSTWLEEVFLARWRVQELRNDGQIYSAAVTCCLNVCLKVW